jgi:hypothetical protein
MKTENAFTKIDNLNTLAALANRRGLSFDITADEDGFYIIGNRTFTDFRAALKFISEVEPS